MDTPNKISDFATDCRNKCAACYRQFNKKEHLVEHMRTSYHSVHEPMCGLCKKHCRSFESLREHLIGMVPNYQIRNNYFLNLSYIYIPSIFIYSVINVHLQGHFQRQNVKEFSRSEDVIFVCQSLALEVLFGLTENHVSHVLIIMYAINSNTRVRLI